MLELKDCNVIELTTFDELIVFIRSFQDKDECEVPTCVLFQGNVLPGRIIDVTGNYDIISAKVYYKYNTMLIKSLKGHLFIISYVGRPRYILSLEIPHHLRDELANTVVNGGKWWGDGKSIG